MNRNWKNNYCISTVQTGPALIRRVWLLIATSRLLLVGTFQAPGHLFSTFLPPHPPTTFAAPTNPGSHIPRHCTPVRTAQCDSTVLVSSELSALSCPEHTVLPAALRLHSLLLAGATIHRCISSNRDLRSLPSEWLDASRSTSILEGGLLCPCPPSKHAVTIQYSRVLSTEPAISPSFVQLTSLLSVGKL